MYCNSTRRRFATVSSAACVASLGAQRISFSANEIDQWVGLPVGVQSISLREYSISETISHLQGMGVRHLEFSPSAHLPATASDQQIAQARELAATADLKVSDQALPVRFERSDSVKQGVTVKPRGDSK